MQDADTAAIFDASARAPGSCGSCPKYFGSPMMLAGAQPAATAGGRVSQPPMGSTAMKYFRSKAPQGTA